MNIYQKYQRHGGQYRGSCVSLNQDEIESLMKGAVKADRKKVIKAAYESGVISKTQMFVELKRKFYNPYRQLKTKTHLIYVNSAIEHFIEIINE